MPEQKEMFKILVVEDEPVVLRALSDPKEWTARGFRLIGSTLTAGKALEMIREDAPDVILTDICMPDMTGIDMMTLLRGQAMDCEFVILSGYSEFDYARSAIRLRAFEYLTKPINERQFEETFARLHAWLDRKRGAAAADGGLEQDRICRLAEAVAGRDVARAEAELEAFFALFPRQDDSLYAALNELFAAILERCRLEGMTAPFPAAWENVRLMPDSGLDALRGQVRSGLEECMRGIRCAMGERTSDLVRSVSEYVQNHVEDRLSLEDLARMHHVSPFYLSRFFKQKTGLNLNSFVNGRKVEQAKRYLARSGKSVQEIALRMGFSEYRYFCVVFKRMTGETPLEYRRRLLLGKGEGN